MKQRTRELMLLRHGKSSWSSGLPDLNRPLKTRGKRGAQRIGAWLWQQDLRPDLIISSPAERAINTAHKCCKSAGRSTADLVIEEQRLYLASLKDLLGILGELPADLARIMLVGHNPGLEELLHHLAGDTVTVPDDGKLLPTASLARLSLPADWHNLAGNSGTLEGIVRPRDLPETFPYPAPNGRKSRPRPAYYYTQSAVIPYRISNDGQPEFLIIGSSGKKHWVFPKGIKEPGLTPQQSAAREAREEAGVQGQVENDRLGRYRYEKWDGICTVDVYAMRVTAVDSNEDWEENHRERRWLPANSAAKLLKQAELRKFLLKLAQQLAL